MQGALFSATALINQIAIGDQFSSYSLRIKNICRR
jgi:hypothetical protein